VYASTKVAQSRSANRVSLHLFYELCPYVLSFCRLLVAVIPKGAILSARSCWQAEELDTAANAMKENGWDAHYGSGAQLLLALALYTEQLRGSASRWHGYLASMPGRKDWAGIGLLWNVSHDAIGEDNDGNEEQEDRADACAAAQWLNGTTSEAYMFDEHGRPLIDSMRSFYNDVAEPLLARHHSPEAPGYPRMRAVWCWSGFCHAFALVCARAFAVDAFHGLAMVPVADASLRTSLFELLLHRHTMRVLPGTAGSPAHVHQSELLSLL